MKNFIEISTSDVSEKTVTCLVNLRNVQAITNENGKATFVFVQGVFATIQSNNSYEEVKRAIEE